MELFHTLRKLPSRAGTGVSDFRNEYLTVLARDFTDARAASVIPAFERFAEKYINAELPDWFYAIFCITKLVAPVKDSIASPAVAPVCGHWNR